MPKLLFVVVLVVAIGAIGYWREWFTVTRDDKVDVQVDSAKFQQDKEAFRNKVREEAKVVKDKVRNLWKQSDELKGDEKANTEKELAELDKKHDRLEKQIKELDDAGQDKFESIKEDLLKSLEDVQKKFDELTKKLAKGKAK